MDRRVSQDAVSGSQRRKCPECGGAGLRIVYGMPSLELAQAADRGELVIGGCVINGHEPDGQCRVCGHTWRTDRPAVAGPQGFAIQLKSTGMSLLMPAGHKADRTSGATHIDTEGEMGRRTFAQVMIDQLVLYPKDQASVRKLAGDLDWDEAKVERVVTAAMSEPSTPIDRGPGGVIRYRGAERGTTPGIYYDVKRVIQDYWGPRRGLRSVQVDITSRSGRRGAGVWCHPDLVMSALPARRRNRDDPPRLHSIEVEVNTGFDIKSVYQAHAQGRGANFSWVFFASSTSSSPNFERIDWAAKELEIGLVEFTKSGSYGTYRVRREAEPREVSEKDRAIFCENTGFQDL